MRIKSLVLGGVAAASLGYAAPALAFTHHPGTPAEHRQTEDLNQQQLEKAQAQDQTAMQANAAAPSDQQATASNGSDNAQMQATAQTSATDQQANASAQTDNAQMEANAQTSATDQQANASTQTNNMQMQADAGTPQTAGNAQAGAMAQTAGTTPVTSLPNPPQALANASVETNNGQAIGAVQRVITDASGKAKAVVVSLLGKMNKLVEIAANELSFDESRNVVVAQLDADQINALPPAPAG